MSRTRISVFLSHSDKDKKIARKFSDELEKHGFDVFVAPDDIEIGEVWMNRLIKEIHKCELFVLLLSKNFKEANFTDHEVGIACGDGKAVSSILIDDTKPYGFMKKFQSSQPIDKNIIPEEIKSLSYALRSNTDKNQKIINELIKKLRDVEHFSEANEIITKLYYYKVFSEKQINDIAMLFLRNDQISESNTKDKTKEIFKENWEKIESKYQIKLAALNKEYFTINEHKVE